MQCTVCQQVNLQTGIPDDSINETCTAGAGTLLLEFGLLSRLLGDPVYEGFARRAVNQLWSHRSNVTGLFGNTIHDSVYLTCSKKLTGSQLSPPHGINKKLKCEIKNQMVSVIGPVQSRYCEAVQ